MTSSAKRRRSSAPDRLTWPSGGTFTKEGFSSEKLSKGSESLGIDDSSLFCRAKRTRRPRATGNNASSSSSSSSLSTQCSLWVDKHAPTRVQDLCVAPKKVQECREWLKESVETNSGRLLVIVGAPGIGKSTMIRCLAKENKWSLAEWNDAHSAPFRRSNESEDVVLESMSPLNTFEEFLRLSGSGYQRLNLRSGGEKVAHEKNAIILLDTLPNVVPSLRERFQQIMRQHLSTSVVPTVLIFSNVFEGKHRPEDLEGIIPREILYSNLSLILQIQPATKARLKSAVSRIVSAEGFKINPGICDSLHERSNGDIRSAISTLQYELCGELLSVGKPVNGLSVERDSKLSTFHALGKLLYAKRKSTANDGHVAKFEGRWKDQRGPLEFDPEEVVDRCEMELGGAIHFLSAHSVDFFSDVTELSESLAIFSDSSMMLESNSRSQAAAASLVSRSVAAYNRNPSATRFRQFTKPKIFDVMRKRNENFARLRQIQMRVSDGSNHLALSSILGTTSNFVSDTLAYARRITPSAIDSLDSIHARLNLSASSQGEANAAREAELASQAKLLESDDIEEFED